MDLIAYVRVSTRGQVVDGFGLDAQRAACRAWAKVNGHRIVAWHTDAGKSGALSAAERPGLSAALDDLRPPPRACGLLVARLDRLARELTVQEAVLAVAWNAGAQVFAADSGEVMRDDPSDPMRTALRQIVGVIAQLDRALIVKRLADGRAAKAASGAKATGAYAYGHHGVGKGRERDAAPLPAQHHEAVALTRIVAMRSAGESYRTICAALDTEGLSPRRGDAWQPMTVRRIAQRAGCA